ncbi:MAG TPA: proteasome subunit beta, partial [Jatrophihabitans sp.]|nr:proteasome subunit beta [Jatrophihabitans sp.]
GPQLSGETSFMRLLDRQAPGLLPWHRQEAAALPAAHATTVLAVTFDGGALIAGDRRATMGNLIAQRDIEKVCQADEYSAVAFAGTAGTAIDLVRLYQVELEHYEKIEGVPLTVDGKVNKLGTMVRANLGMAMQGLAVVPLFAGFDLDAGTGRIFTSDVTGAMDENRSYLAVGSGSYFAKSSLKKLYRPGLPEQHAARVCVEALYDAADDDTATGGPDLVRDIYPVLAALTAEGYRRYSDAEVGAIARAVVADRSASATG